ncbi:MAG: alpha/beta fold hydrolase [Halobacteriota archaeon]
MEYVTHRDRTIAYRRSDRGGDGPPVLFLHGSGGTHAVWKAQSRLSDRLPVIALDLSGHGESDDVDADPGYGCLSAYVDDAVAVARETGARVLVGNSLGGAIALTMVLERDLPIDGLVLTGTGAKLGVLEDLLVWLEGDFDRAIDFLHQPDRLFHDADEATLEASREAMRAVGQSVVHRDFLTGHEFDVRTEVGRIDVPALAIAGAYDRLTPTWYHEFLAENIPDCEYHVVDDAAHLPFLERPAAFNDLLVSFVSAR